MVDISQDIEWEQNFEFDQKIQSKVNGDNDDNHSTSSNAASTTSDDERHNAAQRENVKRARRPSNAELMDRVKLQQQNTEMTTVDHANDAESESKHDIDDTLASCATMTTFSFSSPPPTTTNSPASLVAAEHKEPPASSAAAAVAAPAPPESETTKQLQVVNKKRTELSNFYDEEKHIFIVTWGGRPLYTRHGSLSDRHMTSFMGVVSLFPTNVERVNILTQDDIRSFLTYDGVKFVYLVAGPLYLFCVTHTTESIAQIRNSMRYLHALIVMTLTNFFEKTLTQTPQFDMRSIFGPTDYMFLDKLVHDTDTSPTYLFDAYYPLELARTQRDEIGNVIKQCKKNAHYDDGGNSNAWTKKLLYCLLLFNGTIVSCTQAKKRPLHHEDIILLSHFVRNSQSWKQSEAFTPICLPRFEPSGYVYCYVSYFGEISHESEAMEEKHICLMLLTLDGTAFKKCQMLRKAIEHNLYLNALTQAMKDAYFNQHPLRTSFVMRTVLNIVSPEIYTFYYHHIRKKQYLLPQPLKLYNTPVGNQTLFRRLQHLHHHMHCTPVHDVYFERCSTDAAICQWQRGQFEIYVILNSFVSKKDAQIVLSKLVNWINLQANNLFMNAVNW